MRIYFLFGCKCRFLQKPGNIFVVVLNQIATIHVGIGGYLDDIEVYKMRDILAEFGVFVNDDEYFLRIAFHVVHFGMNGEQ